MWIVSFLIGVFIGCFIIPFMVERILDMQEGKRESEYDKIVAEEAKKRGVNVLCARCESFVPWSKTVSTLDGYVCFDCIAKKVKK